MTRHTTRTALTGSGRMSAVTAAPNWLARYRDGGRDEVWTEMRELGQDISDPPWAGEAQPVVAFCPATETADDQARWLVEQFGAVPMALLSWVRLVGDVWLVGTHPEWPDAAAADPLVIEVEGSRLPNSPIRKYFEEDFAAWREWSAVDPEVEPFVLPMAPDRFHKDNVSGGAPYGVVLPDGSVDGTFVADTAVPFVAYLNHVFMSGGFPWPTASFTAQTRITQELAEGLLLL